MINFFLLINERIIVLGYITTVGTGLVSSKLHIKISIISFVWSDISTSFVHNSCIVFHEKKFKHQKAIQLKFNVKDS